MGTTHKKKGGVDAVARLCANRIIDCRDGKQWTQRQLAIATGWNELVEDDRPGALSPSRIGNYEQGTRRIGLEEAQIFGRVFDLPAAYFMGAIDLREARVLAAMQANEPVAPIPPVPEIKPQSARRATRPKRKGRTEELHPRTDGRTARSR